MKNFEEILDSNNNFITNFEKYKEILVLDAMLTDANIPHVLQKCLDGWQVAYPCDGDGIVADAVEHFNSYGGQYDTLELAGLLTEDEMADDTVVGYVSAREAFERINKHYTENNN